MSLRTGYGATKAMEAYGSNAWSRPQFLAFRRNTKERWQARDSIEWQRINMMAQAVTSDC